MARTVNQQEFTAKRNEILDAAQCLVFSKGYEKMSIQDILRELGMSNGAFFHYFDSKAAVLEALIKRMMDDTEQRLLDIVHHPELSALEKLQHFFALLAHARMQQQPFLVELLRIWFADENAVIRQKIGDAVIEQRSPMLTQIIRQGVEEGALAPAHPDYAAEIILSLMNAMSTSSARLLLSFDLTRHEAECIESMIASTTAYTDTIAKVLGIPASSLYLIDAKMFKTWVHAMSGNTGKHV